MPRRSLCPRPRLLRASAEVSDTRYDPSDASREVGTSELFVDVVFASAVARLGGSLQSVLVAGSSVAQRIDGIALRTGAAQYAAGFAVLYALWTGLLNYSTRFAQDTGWYRCLTFTFMACVVAAVVSGGGSDGTLASLQRLAACGAAGHGVLLVAYIEIYARTLPTLPFARRIIGFARLQIVVLSVSVAALLTVCAASTATASSDDEEREMFEGVALALVGAALLGTTITIALVMFVPCWIPQAASRDANAPCHKRNWCSCCCAPSVTLQSSENESEEAVEMMPSDPQPSWCSSRFNLLPLHLEHFSDRLSGFTLIFIALLVDNVTRERLSHTQTTPSRPSGDDVIAGDPLWDRTGWTFPLPLLWMIASSLGLAFSLKLLAFASDVDAVADVSTHPLRRDRLLGLLWAHSHFPLALGLALLASALALLCAAAVKSVQLLDAQRVDDGNAHGVRESTAGRLLLCVGLGIAVLGLTLIKAASAPVAAAAASLEQYSAKIAGRGAGGQDTLADLDFYIWARRRERCRVALLSIAYVVQTTTQLGLCALCAFFTLTSLGSTLSDIELLAALTAATFLVLVFSYLDELVDFTLPLDAAETTERSNATPEFVQQQVASGIRTSDKKRWLLMQLEAAVLEASAGRGAGGDVAPLLARTRALIAFEKSGSKAALSLPVDPSTPARSHPPRASWFSRGTTSTTVAGSGIAGVDETPGLLARALSSAQKTGQWLSTLSPFRSSAGELPTTLYGAVGEQDDGDASASAAVEASSAAAIDERRDAVLRATESRAVSDGQLHAQRRRQRMIGEVLNRVLTAYRRKNIAPPIGVGSMNFAQLTRLEKTLGSM